MARPPQAVVNANNLKRGPIPAVSSQMPIVDPDTGKVTRAGQLLLQQLQAPSVTQGTHNGRPDASSAPDGALYVESDRNVLYWNYQGTWEYIAGTMWGTLSPDQRPTDLEVHDSGFDYRTTDQPPREFIWSGGAWVEVTPVQKGTHAARPAASTMADGVLYVEWDRGSVMYQVEAGAWRYIAGTMWGTMSPDQRPTDLGANDSGFDFRTTDSPPREFIWSGGAWIETTPVGNPGTLVHPNVVTKVGATAGQIVEGGITDQSAANSNSVFITSGGSVGISTTNPLNLFQVHGATNQNLGMRWDGTAMGIAAFNDAGLAVPMNFNANDFNFLGGNVGINVATAAYQLHLAADSAGKPSTSTWTIASDSRLKRNIRDLSGGLDVILRLRPVEGEYNGADGTPEGQRVVSFLAEEIRDVLPGTVTAHRAKLREADDTETDILDFNIHEVLMHLILAVKQLAARMPARRVQAAGTMAIRGRT